MPGNASEHEVIEVDIATRSVSAEEDIYIVRPGAGYAFYREFDRAERVFLEFPALGIDPAHKPDSTTMRQMIGRSLAVQEWIADGKAGFRPSDDLRTYESQVKGRHFGRYAGAITNLFYDLKQGSIIVVPSPDIYTDVLVGVISGPTKLALDTDAYPGEKVAVRPVKWVGRRRRALFNQDVQKALSNSHPVMQLPRSLRRNVLEAGFDRFIFEGQFFAKFETTNPEFSTLDDYDIQTFINFVAGAVAASQSPAIRSHSLGIGEAIRQLRQHPEFTPELISNINSPGFLGLKSDRISPLVASTLFSVALVLEPTPATAGHTHTMPQIQITNSAAGPHDPCAVSVADEARNAMELMLYDDWVVACEKARDAHQATGVRTNMGTSTRHKAAHHSEREPS